MILEMFPPVKDTRKTKEKHNTPSIFLSTFFYTLFLFDSIKNNKQLQIVISTYMLLQSLKNTIRYFTDK